MVEEIPEWDEEEAPLKLMKVLRYKYDGSILIDEVPEISVGPCPQCGKNMYLPEADRHKAIQHGG